MNNVLTPAFFTLFATNITVYLHTIKSLILIKCNNTHHSIPTICSSLITNHHLSPQAVDVIGKAGTPKTIAGSHTHTTPVLLSFGERAELATDEYLPLSPVMEGFVILKKNEDSVMATVH